MNEGPAFGEPMSQWSLLPFVPGDLAADQRYAEIRNPGNTVPVVERNP